MAELRRRAVLDSEKWAIKIMGMNGLHASAIVEKLKRMGRGSFTVGQIYHILKGYGISTLDYRNGSNEQAGGIFRIALKNAKGATAALPVKRRKRRSVAKKRRKYT